MSDGIPLDLPFKGGRDYLHGTDLFQSLVDVTGARGPLALRIRRMMRTGVRAVACDDAARLKRAAAQFRFEEEGVVRRLAVEEDGRAVLGRTEYDEDGITEKARFGSGFVELEPPAGHSWIERVVSHHKQLVRREVAPVAWLFTGIELERWPVGDDPLRIELAQKLGTRTARSDIRHAGQVVGRITFTVRQ
ncbi:MAG: hypothetical protein QNK05_00060 [Myxococcota bacterium]|nr:hypothetical protein [Myxococcota bacterium]